MSNGTNYDLLAKDSLKNSTVRRENGLYAGLLILSKIFKKVRDNNKYEELYTFENNEMVRLAQINPRAEQPTIALLVAYDLVRITQQASELNSDEKTDKTESILAASLFISVHVHDFLVKVKFDKEELEIAEKVFALVDSLVLIRNIDELEQLMNAIPARTGLRYQMYIERIGQEEIQNIKNLRAYAN
jgi:nicotinate-nucleotide pyrophosphorylase